MYFQLWLFWYWMVLGLNLLGWNHKMRSKSLYIPKFTINQVHHRPIFCFICINKSNLKILPQWNKNSASPPIQLHLSPTLNNGGVNCGMKLATQLVSFLGPHTICITSVLHLKLATQLVSFLGPQANCITSVLHLKLATQLVSFLGQFVLHPYYIWNWSHTICILTKSSEYHFFIP